VREGIVSGKVAKKEHMRENGGKQKDKMQRAIDGDTVSYRTLSHFKDYLFFLLLTLISKSILAVEVAIDVVFPVPLRWPFVKIGTLISVAA